MIRATLIAAVVALASASVPAHAAWDQERPLYAYTTMGTPGDEIAGSSVKVERLPDAIRMEVTTYELNPGHVYTVWLMVFNAPQHCIGDPEGPTRCSLVDLYNPRAESGHLWAGGRRADSAGPVVFRSTTSVGQAPIFAWETGLTAPTEAELMIVLRDHGPELEDSDQAETMNGGCPEALVMPGTGTPGTNSCSSPQLTAFPAP